MKKSWVLALTALALAAFGLAGAGAEIDARHGDNLDVQGDVTDMVFAAGDRITLAMNSTDDVFATGKTIEARGAHADHLFAAGETITLTDSVVRDVYAAGQSVTLVNGQVSDDFIAAGKSVSITCDARVDGALIAAGRDITIDGPVGGGVRAAGATVRIDSAITGNVNIEGETIIIGPQARITGNLTHRGRTVQIDPAAQVSGQTTALTPRPRSETQRKFAHFASVWGALTTLGMILLGVVVAMAFPRLMDGTLGRIRAHPGSSIGFGLLILCATPILAILLIVSVFGLPLAFLLLAIFALLWPLGITGAAYTIGMLTRGVVQRSAPPAGVLSRAAWTALALIGVTLLGMIPLAGDWIWLVVFLFGFGAVAVEAARSLAGAPKPA